MLKSITFLFISFSHLCVYIKIFRQNSYFFMCKAPMEKGKKSVKNAQSKSLLVSQSRSITVTEPPEDAGARPLA